LLAKNADICLLWVGLPILPKVSSIGFGGCLGYLTKYISKMTLIGEPTLESDVCDRRRRRASFDNSLDRNNSLARLPTVGYANDPRLNDVLSRRDVHRFLKQSQEVVRTHSRDLSEIDDA
jgi:hypothetical protein